MVNIQSLLTNTLETILGWPFIIYVLTIGLICTVACDFVQFRYFFRAWKATFFPERSITSKPEQADMTPFQAFLSALNSSIGNGTLAGIATAVYAGGPGAIFWIFTMGFVLMAIRFSEVYLSSFFSTQAPIGTVIGGPMLYLKALGKWAPYLYAIFCLFFGFTVGNTMQSNSINLSFTTTTGIDAKWYIAIITFLFVGYIICGGASRVAKASEAIVPVKVGLFFSSVIILLLYHYNAIIPSFALIIKSAFSPVAIAGGITGFGIQYAMREGFSRLISATESGLGIAGIQFGSTGSTDPFKDGLMGMLSAFISSMACFMTGLCIIASGVWNSGQQSSALASQAFETIFGGLGNWIVMILSISFGMGVLVAYSYITREAWLFLTRGRYIVLFGFTFCFIAFLGPLINVSNVWFLVATATGLLIGLNLAGIIWLLPIIRQGIKNFAAKESEKIKL